MSEGLDQVRLAVLQMHCEAEPQLNLEKCVAMVEEAARAGAQVIVPPYLFGVPCFWRYADYDAFPMGESIPGPTTAALSKVAAGLGVVVVASIFERRTHGVYHSSAAAIDADGQLLGVYRQMHLCTDSYSHEGFYFSPGDLGFKVFHTRYAKVGVLLGWDQWYPEAARITALQGADVMVYPTAWGIRCDQESEVEYSAWETILRSHAMSNAAFVGVANRVGREAWAGRAGDFWGQSFISDPYGTTLAKAGAASEQISMVECNLTALDKQRTHWPFFRDRRIDAYGGLTKRALD